MTATNPMIGSRYVCQCCGRVAIIMRFIKLEEVYWVLTITKQMKAVDYNDRLAVSRELTGRIASVGLRHQSLKTAMVAAEYISKNPLVVQVAVTKYTEVSEGVWRNGRRYKE